jgi:hypothetical protein
MNNYALPVRAYIAIENRPRYATLPRSGCTTGRAVYPLTGKKNAAGTVHSIDIYVLRTRNNG